MGRFDYWDIAPPRTIGVLKRHISSIESIHPQSITSIYIQDDGDPAEDSMRLRRDGERPHGLIFDSPIAIVYSSAAAQRINETLASTTAPVTPEHAETPLEAVNKPDPTAVQLQLSRHGVIMDPKHPGKALTSAKPRNWVTARSTGNRKFSKCILSSGFMLMYK